MDFIDLKKQYQVIKPSVQKRINDIFDRASYIMGKEIDELEATLAAYTGAPHCLTCSSGTDALLLPLMAMGVGPGDAVFTTTFTFIATAEVISLLGATPIFVDIDKNTYNMDPAKLRQAIIAVQNGSAIASGIGRSLRPRAIIPVDLFGLCADYEAIDAIAREFNLFVIEDAAQSFGAISNGKKAGSFGTIAATSFFPAKPLGCYGDGGAVFCRDESLLAILKSLRVHGQGDDKYENVRIGINGRLDTIQAAVLLAKMEIFEAEIVRRQNIAAAYSDALKNSVVAPHIPANNRSAWAQYSVQTDDRDQVLAGLKARSVPTAVYYPKPLHLQKAFLSLGYEPGQFPIAEEIAAKIFSLPMHPYLDEHTQEQIIKAVITST